MKDHEGLELTRREFLIAGTAAAAVTLVNPDAHAETKAGGPIALIPVTLQINGHSNNLQLDSRTSLLDALREHLRSRERGFSDELGELDEASSKVRLRGDRYAPLQQQLVGR